MAVAGAIPLTTGTLIWVIGSVMGIGFHGRWSGIASAGRMIALAGLLPGLVMIILATSERREVMRTRPRTQGQPAPTPCPLEPSLLPVAPEHQAVLADPPRPDQVPPANMAHPPPGDPSPGQWGVPPGEWGVPPGEWGVPPGEWGVPPGESLPGVACEPSGDPLPGQWGGPPGEPLPGVAYGPPGESCPPDQPMRPEAASAYPPARRPWPAPGTFGTGGPSDGQPYDAGPALPPYPAQPDDTYPGFPADPGPPFGAGPPLPGDDYPGFHRERGFPVPPQSRGEGGYRRLAAPQEWW